VEEKLDTSRGNADLEVIREKAQKPLEELARELKLKPRQIELREDLSPLGKNLFARMTGDGGIEIFEPVENQRRGRRDWVQKTI